MFKNFRFILAFVATSLVLVSISFAQLEMDLIGVNDVATEGVELAAEVRKELEELNEEFEKASEIKDIAIVHIKCFETHYKARLLAHTGQPIGYDYFARADRLLEAIKRRAKGRHNDNIWKLAETQHRKMTGARTKGLNKVNASLEKGDFDAARKFMDEVMRDINAYYPFYRQRNIATVNREFGTILARVRGGITVKQIQAAKDQLGSLPLMFKEKSTALLALIEKADNELASRGKADLGDGELDLEKAIVELCRKWLDARKTAQREAAIEWSLATLGNQPVIHEDGFQGAAVSVTQENWKSFSNDFILKMAQLLRHHRQEGTEPNLVKTAYTAYQLFLPNMPKDVKKQWDDYLTFCIEKSYGQASAANYQLATREMIYWRKEFSRDKAKSADIGTFKGDILGEPFDNESLQYQFRPLPDINNQAYLLAGDKRTRLAARFLNGRFFWTNPQQKNMQISFNAPGLSRNLKEAEADLLVSDSQPPLSVAAINAFAGGCTCGGVFQISTKSLVNEYLADSEINYFPRTAAVNSTIFYGQLKTTWVRHPLFFYRDN